ncbi:MAG: hypothetical protein NC826_06805, partial [Candidatus Omnitrophica bacterium]|nr:hypothetical protein [Candidatus Omnitrophota bacterium]
SIVENLAELMAEMKTTKAHLGITFDLDGDRGAVVIPVPNKDSITKDNFTILPPDNLMQVLLPFLNVSGYSVKERGKVGVVRDVLSTKGVDKKAEELGYESYQTDAGYVFLKAKVKALKENGYTIPIYSERSGHTWTQVTGAFEDPIIVSLFFNIIVSEHLQKNPTAPYPALEVYKKNSIPYKQSTRFQPLFGKPFLRQLSDDPENKSGWRFGQTPIPMEIVSLGRHRAIEQLKGQFQKGKEFKTPVGRLTVSEFNFYFDPEIKANRFADIRFSLDGKDAGSFVFRASSNEPTWVCSFETPLWEGETFEAESVFLRYISVGGLVLDFLETSGIASVTEGNYPNKSDAEETLNKFRELMNRK